MRIMEHYGLVETIDDCKGLRLGEMAIFISGMINIH